MRNVSTHRSITRSYPVGSEISYIPTEGRTSSSSVLSACLWDCALAGGWSGDFLADWGDIVKHNVSEVHVKRLTSRSKCRSSRFMVSTFFHVLMDQERYVAPRLLRHRQPGTEDHVAGCDSDTRPTCTQYSGEATSTLTGLCQGDLTLSSVKRQRKSTIFWVYQVISVTVITWHLAVSCKFHRSHRSQSL